MIGSRQEVADFGNKITAWRTFCFSNQQLTSYSQDTAWDKQIQAECKVGKFSTHVSPQKNCHCGIYGWFEDKELLGHARDVYAVCEYWGTCEVHEKGLRSEYASIKAISPVINFKNSGRHLWKKNTFNMFYANKSSLPGILDSKTKTFWMGLTVSTGLYLSASFLSHSLFNSIFRENTAYIIFLTSNCVLLVSIFQARRAIAVWQERLGIKKWAKKHNVQFENSVEDLKKHHTHAFPAKFLLQKDF